jgi:hypothetical protein
MRPARGLIEPLSSQRGRGAELMHGRIARRGIEELPGQILGSIDMAGAKGGKRSPETFG